MEREAHILEPTRATSGGGPLLPLLFNIVADALGVKMALQKNHIKGILDDLIPGGLSHTVCG
jgi:hypothetical protein